MSLRTFDAGGEAMAAFWPRSGPVVVMGDGRILRPDPAGGTLSPTAVHDGGILCADLGPDGETVLSGGDDGRLAATASDGSTRTLADFGGRWVDQVAASPVSGLIACSAGRKAWVFDRKGARTHAFDHPSSVGGLGFDAKGKRLAVAHYDGVSLWWAGDAGSQARVLTWKGSHIGVVFSPDGRFVVSTMQENALHGWRLADGADMRMAGYGAKVRSLAWAGKGRLLATSGAARAILWPFQTRDGPMGRPPVELGMAGALVTRVAATTRGDRVAAGDAEGAVMVCDVASTMPVTSVPGDGSRVVALAFSPDGRALVCATEAGRIGLADVAGD